MDKQKLSLRESVLLIRAGSGYFIDGIRRDGYRIVSPYKERGGVYRILREICFRLPFLPKKCWYNLIISEVPYKNIIIFDPLITSHFLIWLKNKQRNAHISFAYMNLVGKARHINPKVIPPDIDVWSYDKGDCEKYNLNFLHNNPFFMSFLKPKVTPKYDIMFVGADKGRGEYLLSLEEKLNKYGFKTKFIITKDSIFSKKKPYYQSPISYDELTDIIAESRAILNVVMPSQTGITMRDIESLLFGVKLITTNRKIKEKDFYNPNNVYELSGLEIDGLYDFMQKPTLPVSDDIKKRYSVDSFVTEIISNV